MVRTHDEVELRHAPQQRSALLRRHAPRHHQLQAAHVLALALGLRRLGAASQGRLSLSLLTKKYDVPRTVTKKGPGLRRSACTKS